MDTPIKQSHSIQRNGRLSIIEGDVNGQQAIYTFTEVESDEYKFHNRSVKMLNK
ncbi:MAG: hypothetical protein JWP12_1040 [Bacteroidetes bacterium]|nr:hypothetical protein [Bacteroidota bacterium]